MYRCNLLELSLPCGRLEAVMPSLCQASWKGRCGRRVLVLGLHSANVRVSHLFLKRNAACGAAGYGEPDRGHEMASTSQPEASTRVARRPRRTSFSSERQNYRPNVGIIIFNKEFKVFMGRVRRW